MIRRVFKRCMLMALALLMAITIIPAVSIPVYAAEESGTVAGLLDKDIELTYSGENVWSANGDTIKGSIKNTSGSCESSVNQESTLTITNRKDANAQLSFSYTVVLSGGSVLVDGKSADTSGSFEKEIEPGGSIDIFIKSGGDTETVIDIAAISLIENVTATTVFQPAEHGTYTVDSQEISEEWSSSRSSLDPYEVSAIPENGYQFLGWYDLTNDRYLSTKQSDFLNIDSDRTITAKFVDENTAIFTVNGTPFADLNEAVAYAQENQSNKIVLAGDGEFSGEAIIPSGITLLIPFDEQETLYAEAPGVILEDLPNKAYRTLTMTEDSSIVIEGAISVGGRYYAAAGSAKGQMTGNYGHIQMEEGSTITVKDGGTLYAWGFITGNGSVLAENGADVYEFFQIGDFRGGSQTLSMIGSSVFPFSQYYVQNVEVPLTLEADANENVYSGVYMSGSIQNTSISFIGEAGMFKLKSGSFTKDYDEKTDRMIFTVNGEAELNPLTLRLGIVNVDSAKFVLPITNNITLNIDSGKVTVNQDTALLAGVKVNIAEAADLTVAEGKNLYLYDRDEWTERDYSWAGKYTSVEYAPGKAYSRTEGDLLDAKIDVNGTLTAAGSIYTTAGGADICSSLGHGKYIQSGMPGTGTVTYQYGRDGIRYEIPISAAMLHNADDTYTKTSYAMSGETIEYKNGVWGEGPVTEATITFDANDGSGKTATQTVIVGKENQLNSNIFVRDGYSFTGWNTKADGTGVEYADNASINPEGDLTLYAQWKNSGLSVTWVNDDGTVLERDENLSYGELPEYNGEIPSKVADAQYIYIFKGWTPEITEVTQDTVYHAEYTKVTRQYTITWKNEDTILSIEQFPYGKMPVYSGETPTKPANEDYRYVFKGWTPSLTSVTGDAVYTAQFDQVARVFHTVNFDANGGSGNMESQIFESGISTEINDNTFVRDGYIFVGWNTEADGSGIAYDENSTLIDLQEDMTLYAQWEIKMEYADFLSSLTVLERYADEFVREHPDEESIALVINYIRCGVEKYTTGTWNTFCGEEKTLFTNYVASQDKANGTNAGRLRHLNVFTLPNGDEVDFAHMFGCMDMAYHTKNQSTADLGSWAGDICDLLQLTSNAGVNGTVEEMAEEIRTDNDHYFLYDDPNGHSFGRLDLYADLDAQYILARITDGLSISSIMTNYYTENLNEEIRARFFLTERFGDVSTKASIREAVFDAYSKNEGVRTLEGTYLPDGVDADLRKACCYAFADYLYETAKSLIENPYFNVFSSTVSNLAPGITQEVKMALTKDDQQIVYYLATADITRNDVDVYANYNNNDGSKWQMSRVTDQMKAAEEKHSNPEDEERYIPDYSAIVGVNADFYDMSNGAPSGALVMEGIEYHGVGSENFFGILKDGTPVIGGSAEWKQYEGQIQEAVGASTVLVKDGKIAVTSTDDYYTSRASRTCVGITFDGQIVLMVLDGRQEPFSAGGSAIEIAQIMLDAGCISAVNLDGGGSSTFAAKGEGTDTISVVNRPSDGYERSVSSSLLVVSTAKPSNVFDHAILSADYDYLTVGTELSIQATGVTASGGAIDLPENTSLKLVNDEVGTLSEDGVFTAEGLGDAQIQLLAEDGTVLGSKTLHVVEPEELRFDKTSINAVYGETEELPMKATYHGNEVKINANDVQFGFLKISLESIGSVEGGTINTTRTELVYEYPEAGTINNFDFTANPDTDLRTLTIGAILKNKMSEFQATINEEYKKAFAEAKANGLSDDQAAIQAESTAIGKALDGATEITVYLYQDDEMNFDFDQANGQEGLLAWQRIVENARYDNNSETYYLNDPNASGEVSYTFAMDMTKVPIPEKLSGLLYMLPGGDQEGRSAWDFLLQLAERISPLTTVTVDITIPDGFKVDVSELRLANEYFTMSSTEINGNKLTITFNFVEQSGAINPATANPLCVLSGLKLIPEENVSWNTEGRLECTLSGSLSYDIYAHFHSLKNIAQDEEFQKQYGLYPYDNSANDPDDYGAHFLDTVVEFNDLFSIQKKEKDGWVNENDEWSYYENGVALTGIHQLPSNVAGEEGMFWYDLGANGTCKGKLTGIFEYEGKRYYSRAGKLVSGWQSIIGDDKEAYFYYFDQNDYSMYTGVRDVAGLTYTFNEDGQLVRGAFRTDERGTKYFFAGESLFRRFITLEEGTYWLDVDGYVAYGNAYTVTTNVKDITWYHFDEKTGLLAGVCDGFIEYRGERYYCEDGKVFYGPIKVDDGIVVTGTYGKLYTNTSFYVDNTTVCKDCSLETGKYWCDENGYIVSDGFVDIDGDTYYFSDYQRAKGLMKIGEDYYLFNAGNGKMYKDATMWVGDNEYGFVGGMYYFQEDGKMFIPDLVNGKKEIIEENGNLYFTIDGVKMTNGLNELNGEYYYAQSNGVLIKDATVWVSQKNGLIPEKGNWYAFDDEGKLIQTGFVNGGDGYTYYYKDNELALGFTKIGEDYYLFNAGSGKMYKDATMWVGDNEYGFVGGMYYFQEDGKMLIG